LGAIFPVGFCGVDGEGFELRQALAARPGVRLDFFLQTPERRTFTYCKPLVLRPGQPPEELNRLDSKNWTPTPSGLETQLMDALGKLIAVERVNALIFLEQVDLAETGVITTGLLKAIGQIAAQTPGLLLIGDSRRGLRNWPPIMFKMNVSELGVLTGQPRGLTLEEIQRAALALARQNGRTVFVTLSERGLLGASAHGQCELVPALPVRGPIDIVGAGDAVTANLAAALAAGAGLREALEIANTAASVVIHQLGTTGTANVAQIRGLLP
jgi:bifunctional ADP-heptose synthase (sugar kinase/adenylyltransferase)